MLAPHLHNRTHSHVAASLLVSLGSEPIRVQLAGHWITAEAVWAAPDVDQALDSDGPVAVLHLDPDHRAWRALRLQGPGGEFPLAEHPRFRACLNELAASPSAAAALAARATLEAGEPRPLDPRVVLACRALRRGDDAAGLGGAALAEAVQVWFDSPERVAALESDFTRVHEQLRGGANDKAADAIAALLAPGRGTQDHA
ncbi:MAG TPA: hypothetical protein DCE35_00120 [Alcanivorax sp.]|nr:hypothetical protein [Alcanivorax sp.]